MTTADMTPKYPLGIRCPLTRKKIIEDALKIAKEDYLNYIKKRKRHKDGQQTLDRWMKDCRKG
jgi:hypothetical protein